MTTALAKTAPRRPWAPAPDETPEEHLQFMIWAYHGGELVEGVSGRHNWALRAQQLAALDAVKADPSDQATTAVLQQVEILFVEMDKLHRDVTGSPERLLSPREIADRMSWITEQMETLQARQADAIDYSQLSPEDREIMIKAADIQERLGR